MILLVPLLLLSLSTAAAQPRDLAWLAAKVEALAAGPPPWSVEVRLQTICPTPGGTSTWSIDGSGVAVRDRRFQYRLLPPDLSRLMRLVANSGFLEWETVYGSNSSGPLRIVCQVRLEIDSAEKSVRQLNTGTRFEPLFGLAAQIDAIGRNSGPARTADSLHQALQQLAASELAPAGFSLSLHRRDAPNALEGRILRISGLDATSRTFGQSQNIERASTVAPEQLAALAQELLARGFDRLPLNLDAPGYTDLVVEVLGHRRALQARPFAASNEPTPEESRQSFEGLLSYLTSLHRELFPPPG